MFIFFWKTICIIRSCFVDQNNLNFEIKSFKFFWNWQRCTMKAQTGFIKWVGIAHSSSAAISLRNSNRSSTYLLQDTVFKLSKTSNEYFA